MKCLTKLPALLLFIASIQSITQSVPESQAQDTQVRGFWIDPSTGLMWAEKDNGKDVSFKNAVKYCRDLRLAGYSDWRLANMPELQGIYDTTANAPGRAGSGNGRSFTWHVKGNLFLTGYEWANDQSGRVNGYHWYFDFNERRSNNQEAGFLFRFDGDRALCVRGSGDPLGGQRHGT